MEPKRTVTLTLRVSEAEAAAIRAAAADEGRSVSNYVRRVLSRTPGLTPADA